MIVNLFTGVKLDVINHDIERQKIQFLLNKCEVLEHLTASMFARADKDVIANEQ